MAQKNSNGEPYFVVSLGSQWVCKKWPAEWFAAVAQKISDTFHLKCCIVGTDADNNWVDRFLQLYHGECRDLMGKTPLQELIAVLSNARFVICNETGISHVTIACKTKMFLHCIGQYASAVYCLPGKRSQ